MPIETWLFFLLVALVPAVSPGPAILLAISNTLRFGRNATLASATGNALGLVLVGFAVAFGLGAVMEVSALAFTLLKAVGAVYLIYLGIKIWRDKTGFNSLDNSLCTQKSHRTLFLQALLVSITNPKAILVISALFPQFMSKGGVVLSEIVILSFTYAALCWLNHAFIAIAGAHLRRFIMAPGRMTLVRRVTGGLFIGFGAALAGASR